MVVIIASVSWKSYVNSPPLSKIPIMYPGRISIAHAMSKTMYQGLSFLFKFTLLLSQNLTAEVVSALLADLRHTSRLPL